MDERLTLTRIRQARETLTAAFGLSMQDFPGAREADPTAAFAEAKRNLTALIQWLHGDDAFEETLDEDY